MAKTPRELTPMQEAFLEHLFGECKGNENCAKKKAGYSPGHSINAIRSALREDIIERCEDMMAGAAPKAALNMIGLLDDPSAHGAKTTLATAKEILDRVGIVKKEKLEIDTKGQTAIIMLPSKREDD